MSVPIQFGVLALFLLGLSLSLLLIPLLRRRIGLGIDDTAALVVLREAAAELESSYNEGKLDVAAYELARSELRSRVLLEAPLPTFPVPNQAPRPWLAIWLGIGFALFSLVGYGLLGDWQALDDATTSAAGVSPESMTPVQRDALANRLARQVAATPNDGRSWLALARTQALRREFAAATSAYERALALLPSSAALLVESAETLALMRGRKLEGEPEARLERALALDPGHVKANALLGSLAYSRGRYGEARHYWQLASAGVAGDAEDADTLRQLLAEAERRVPP